LINHSPAFPFSYRFSPPSPEAPVCDPNVFVFSWSTRVIFTPLFLPSLIFFSLSPPTLLPTRSFERYLGSLPHSSPPYSLSWRNLSALCAKPLLIPHPTPVLLDPYWFRIKEQAPASITCDIPYFCFFPSFFFS